MRRVLSLLITVSVLLAATAFETVDAYTTVGAAGRSLQVYSGFTVNRSYLAPLGSACRSGQKLRGFAGVTIHETSNWSYSANAKMHAMYLQGGGSDSEVSWHYSVDNIAAYQSIPEDEKAWHAGDTGFGTGNASTIAIEICDNSGGDFDQAMANAEWLAADILFRHGVYTVDGWLSQHHDFSSFGKNCPITIRDTGRWAEFCQKTQAYIDQMVAAAYPQTESGVVYRGYVQNIGWQEEARDGSAAGTCGRSLRLEGLMVQLKNIGGGIEYRTHVQNYGWQDWTGNGGLSGTEGGGLRLEAAELRLTGAAADQYDVFYRVYVENYGWMGWAKNGETAGTTGLGYRIEMISVKLVPKGGAAPGDTSLASVNASDPGVSYCSSIQDVSWLGTVRNGALSGSVGEWKRLEALKIRLANIDGGVEYRSHVQNIGWQDWTADGAVSGTTGRSLRLEAVQIRLTGAAADQYDIYYRVHAQNFGWMGWAKNGEPSGTAGYAYRLEAVEIILVPKNGAAPGDTSGAFSDCRRSGVSYQSYIQGNGWQNLAADGDISGTTGRSLQLEALKLQLVNLDGGIEYHAHVQNTGWQYWVSDGTTAGTTGQNLRLEAVEIRLTGAAADQYDVYYRVHAQDIGWMGWAKNGQPAGTAGLFKRVEAVQAVLVPKGGAAPGPEERAFVQI